jgi:hypothetical protein
MSPGGLPDISNPAGDVVLAGRVCRFHKGRIMNDAIGSLSTLVNAIDELPDGFDFDALPQEALEILSYINLQSRHVVENASK